MPPIRLDVPRRSSPGSASPTHTRDAGMTPASTAPDTARAAITTSGPGAAAQTAPATAATASASRTTAIRPSRSEIIAHTGCISPYSR
ncbi:hypothetical protein NM203_18505 [Mycolicibacterium sp. CAU 1645]|uniref:Uncharacterized protein n=1 Tax=Mycolicibacterium arenosum TaxID=2952157 RepID=A0ABT1M4X6_9MYCO|nr:hypothetical protein [Mycolicibacterium sp. CAU 1645]MCP9274183.1 hypothetical protein [Mycolicibacterium sp. CAU 1645]